MLTKSPILRFSFFFNFSPINIPSLFLNALIDEGFIFEKILLSEKYLPSTPFKKLQLKMNFLRIKPDLQ